MHRGVGYARFLKLICWSGEGVSRVVAMFDIPLEGLIEKAVPPYKANRSVPEN
jgi:hypothetical protein